MLKIEEITVRNFKALQNVTITNIPRLAVFIGANGTGKTSLFSVFGFLKDCLSTNASRAVLARGGFQELVSRMHGTEPILFEIKYRMEIASKERLVTYHLELTPDSIKPGAIAIKREYLSYKRSSYGSPYHFFDFTAGEGFAVSNEEDFTKADEELKREQQNLGASDILAIKGLGQFSRFKAANEFRKLIEGWHVSDFHIEAARRPADIMAESDHLSASGDNLQSVANNIHEFYPDVFGTIIEKMKKRVPGIGAIDSLSTEDNRLLIRFQDKAFKDPFIDKYVSDGTLKMFTYLILLNDPQPHPLLCIEEPENQLYPKLLPQLLEEFREYAHKGGQVFVSTHSPDLLNAAALDEVFWLSKMDGCTSVFKASENKQIAAYMNDGDKMGYLWSQGFFDGADPE